MTGSIGKWALGVAITLSAGAVVAGVGAYMDVQKLKGQSATISQNQKLLCLLALESNISQRTIKEVCVRNGHVLESN